MTIQIQSYSELYKNKVVELSIEIYEEFELPISIKNLEDVQDEIVHLCQKGSGNFLVALDNEQLVGTIALIDINNGQGALRKMFVNNAYRGEEKRVAHSLLSECIRWCNKNKFKELYLGTRAVFLAAHKFYEKSGFKEIQKSALPASFPLMQDDSKFYMYQLT
jgi:N-acetylglutamate synthase-like GNAT family acetyltransferase